MTDKMKQSLKPGGHIIIATFALDGPLCCSGLDIVRYSPDLLQKEMGSDVELIESFSEVHQTPFETQQKFTYCHFQMPSPSKYNRNNSIKNENNASHHAPPEGAAAPNRLPYEPSAADFAKTGNNEKSHR